MNPTTGCTSSLSTNSTKQSTKSVNFYSKKLSALKMLPLVELEINEIEKAIEAAKDKRLNSAVKIQRTFEQFKRDNHNKPIRTLILGSGEKHADKLGEKQCVYTIDIDEKAQPDILGSINNPLVMHQLPSNSFDYIIWENVPSVALLNTEHFRHVYRILNEGGVASLTIPLFCMRTLPILIQKTPFKEQISEDFGRHIEIIETADCIYTNKEAKDFITDHNGAVILKKI